MKHLPCILLTMSAFLFAIAMPAGATEIGFTGGTATLTDGSAFIPNRDAIVYSALYYDEDDYRVSTVGGTLIVGSYYVTGNDVVHTHWGFRDGTTQINVARPDGRAFDLNAFDLTSNTELTGRPATGDERVFIHASADGVHASYSLLLPPKDWGGAASTVVLGAEFDHIKAFWFTQESLATCFGMDNLVLELSGKVPEPGTLALFGLALAGFVARRRGQQRANIMAG